MIMHGRKFTNYGSVVAALLFALVLPACSDDSPLVDDDALCPGESGVGLRIEGRSQPVDVCIADSAVDALLTSSSHYDVTAQLALDDNSIVELRMVFTRRADTPVTLRLVNSVAEATSDPDAVYVSYAETPDQGSAIESTAITGGTFRLSFNDDTVAAGTMRNVDLDMNNVSNGDPAGGREIVEGFFSVSVQGPPAALSSR